MLPETVSSAVLSVVSPRGVGVPPDAVLPDVHLPASLTRVVLPDVSSPGVFDAVLLPDAPSPDVFDVVLLSAVSAGMMAAPPFSADTCTAGVSSRQANPQKHGNDSPNILFPACFRYLPATAGATSVSTIMTTKIIAIIATITLCVFFY